MTTSSHRASRAKNALALLAICCAAEVATAQTPPPASPPEQLYLGVLVNGRPVDFSARVETGNEVLVDRGCVQPSNTCDHEFLPSVHPPVGPDCLGPMTFVSRDTVTYYVTSVVGGAPRPNCDITVTISPIVTLNGGHCHGDETRPVGTPVAGTYSGNTGSGLDFFLVHTWPQVSGRILVQAVNVPNASCPSIGTTNKNFFICIRGPQAAPFNAGMLQLPEGPGYVLDGGDDNIARHPDHHYGTPSTIGALQALAAEWMNGAPGRPVLEYNDISLRWGGVFDILDDDRVVDWVPPHCGHRNGRTVDVQKPPIAYRRAFKRYLGNYFDIGFDHPSHWHSNLKPEF